MIALTAALLVAAALALGIPLEEDLGRALGVAATVTVLLLGLFDWKLWRYLPASITQRPDLNGTWQATLTYETTPGAQVEKPCYLVIKQTYTRISINLLSDEGCSYSTSAGIVQQGIQQVLSYTYRNEPSTLVQQHSPTHRGAAALSISTTPKLKLSGDYWTERLTKGGVATSGHNGEIYTDFQAAQAAEFS